MGKHDVDNVNWRTERDARHNDRALMEASQMAAQETRAFIVYGWESKRWGEKPQRYGGLYIRIPQGTMSIEDLNRILMGVEGQIEEAIHT